MMPVSIVIRHKSHKIHTTSATELQFSVFYCVSLKQRQINKSKKKIIMAGLKGWPFLFLSLLSLSLQRLTIIRKNDNFVASKIVSKANISSALFAERKRVILVLVKLLSVIFVRSNMVIYYRPMVFLYRVMTWKYVYRACRMNLSVSILIDDILLCRWTNHR